MIDFDYYEEYLTIVSKKYYYGSVKKKVNFDAVDICRLMKNQKCKRRSRKKTLIQTLIFSKLPSSHEFLRRRNVVYITVHIMNYLFMPKNIP